MPLNYMTHNDVIQAYTVYTHIYLIIYIWPSTISDEEGKVYCFSFIPSSVADAEGVRGGGSDKSVSWHFEKLLFNQKGENLTQKRGKREK